jgi:hypothetical protein
MTAQGYRPSLLTVGNSRFVAPRLPSAPEATPEIDMPIGKHGPYGTHTALDGSAVERCPNPNCVNGRVGNVGCAVCKGEPVRDVLHSPAQHIPAVSPPETTAPTATLCAEHCGRPASTLCEDCVVANYQGEHTDCLTCCPRVSPSSSPATPTGTTPTQDGEDDWDGSTPLLDWHYSRAVRELTAALASSQQEVERLRTENAGLQQYLNAAIAGVR